jgi:hypothetical protein
LSQSFIGRAVEILHPFINEVETDLMAGIQSRLSQSQSCADTVMRRGERQKNAYLAFHD